MSQMQTLGCHWFPAPEAAELRTWASPMGLGGLWCLPLLGPVAVPVPVKKGLDVLTSVACLAFLLAS